MTDLRKAAQQALEVMDDISSFDRWFDAREALRAALAEPLTDEQISDLWHQSGEQPFKFARMLVK